MVTQVHKRNKTKLRRSALRYTGELLLGVFSWDYQEVDDVRGQSK